jgi:hypothetical protein
MKFDLSKIIKPLNGLDGIIQWMTLSSGLRRCTQVALSIDAGVQIPLQALTIQENFLPKKEKPIKEKSELFCSSPGSWLGYFFSNESANDELYPRISRNNFSRFMITHYSVVS